MGKCIEKDSNSKVLELEAQIRREFNLTHSTWHLSTFSQNIIILDCLRSFFLFLQKKYFATQ